MIRGAHGAKPEQAIRESTRGRVKDEMMRRVVPAKFTQHADIGETLLATGDTLLVERTTNDS